MTGTSESACVVVPFGPLMQSSLHKLSAESWGVNSKKMASDFGMISHGPQGSILVKRRCGLLNPSFLQRLACVWEEAKGLKVRGQDMCGDQVRVQQRVTVQHKDTPLFSPTALGRFFTTINVEMLWVQEIRNVIGILLACSFIFFLISDTSYEVSLWSWNPCTNDTVFSSPNHLVPPPPFSAVSHRWLTPWLRNLHSCPLIISAPSVSPVLPIPVLHTAVFTHVITAFCFSVSVPRFHCSVPAPRLRPALCLSVHRCDGIIQN